TFLIGSELRGVTRARSSATAFPAVDALVELAADARAILGSGTAIGYAADWSEYFGHQPADGTGDVFFHLDPLWASDDIDFVGIDYYVPLADWRDGDEHLDALAGFEGPHSTDYIAANIEGGEGFDWYYASDADRVAQARTPIADGAYGEPWVFRPKDLRSWWSNAHHDRPGGVRSGAPTAWVPESKPIRLIEFGCPAVDKGANSPNLFVDPKSTESSLPPFSDGTRDDYGQRRCLEAVLSHWSGEPMIEAMSAWCWDARPFPDFPARSGVWADAPNWTLGHWLTGRAGVAPLGDLVRALSERAEVELDVGEVGGVLTGYVVDRPMRLRDALEPLAGAFAFDGAERDGQARLVGRDRAVAATLGADDLALPEKAEARVLTRTLAAPPDVVRLRFIDEAADYQTGALTVRRDPAGGGDAAMVELPMVMTAGEAERIARRMLSRATAARDEAVVHISPLKALALEAGDVIEMEEVEGRWRVVRLDLDENPKAVLQACEPAEAPVGVLPDWTPPPAVEPAGPPVLHLMDLPPLPGAEEDARPLVALACDPWRSMDVHAGVSTGALTVRARSSQSAAVGETLNALEVGPLWRLDRASRLQVRLEGALLESRELDAVLAGANALAVFTSAGEWEVVQFTTATAIAQDCWELSGLLRGQCGSDAAMAPTAAGAPVVLLDEALARASVALGERGLPLIWRAAPAGGPAAGLAMTEAAFTWRGLALRPWAPAHLRVAEETGGLAITWVRRARLYGDLWDAEPPLSEESERYLVEVLDGEVVVRAEEVTEPAFLYTTAMQAEDGAATAVRVAQYSASFGWGAARERALAA
ncbi:MAG TPA: glycoside hydrolase/phage tail family protein, partial [Caulobacteraceae bacterium]|nr:glycoside hydrolase/phage tail family protein [Caulobacteraceae bacterium]